MNIKHENKEYTLNVARAIELGVLKEEKNPKPGEVWQINGESNPILILKGNNYHCICYLENGTGYPPTNLSKDWFGKDSRKIADNLNEYYNKK